MHHFVYKLSVAICRKKNEQNAKLEIVNKVNKRVYASPSKRRMDTKEGETIFTYPMIYFAVDDFEDCFKGVTILQDQQICVQLSSYDPVTEKKCTLFQGGVLYSALRELFNYKKSGWFKKHNYNQLEFLPLRGPRGKGKAQMAVGIQNPELYVSNFWNLSKKIPENPPLHAFLTFITLSWESIINDLLWKS